jgi:hypothetical protein
MAHLQQPWSAQNCKNAFPLVTELLTYLHSSSEPSGSINDMGKVPQVVFDRLDARILVVPHCFFTRALGMRIMDMRRAPNRDTLQCRRHVVLR